MAYEPGSMYFDSNGVLTEHRLIDGMEVIVHYEDIPDSDCTVVDGIPCTTALRSVIEPLHMIVGYASPTSAV